MTYANSKSLARPLKAHHHQLKLMGCDFVITAIDESPQKAWDAIRAAVAEIIRIENLISSWKEDSQTAMINKMAGIEKVQVDPELFKLIKRSLLVSDLSLGAFDISGTLSRDYWNFNKSNSIAPSDERINKLKRLINFRMIELGIDETSVFLKQKGMKIGFGGIGKGYAAQRAFQVMTDMGIHSGLINASGDLMCWGNPPNRKEWEINIPDPKNRSRSILSFSIPNGSVVTSGNFENYTIVDGKHLSHIIDPRTGRPVENCKQVSVVSTNPEFADAMATAISVLGVKLGLKLTNELNGIECIIIDQSDKIYYSNHLKL